MLTENAENMLRSLHASAEEGCLLGLSIWGDKDKNNFLMFIREAILEAGYELPD